MSKPPSRKTEEEGHIPSSQAEVRGKASGSCRGCTLKLYLDLQLQSKIQAVFLFEV